MIASTSTKTGFGELAEYLEYGEGASRVEDPAQRVAWSERRGLLSTERAEIVEEMNRAAQMNTRVEKPCYHLVISWDGGDAKRGTPADRPTRAQMREAADRALEALDLTEHQAWIVAHRDGGTEHLHIMVNRVHPETGEAWNPWRDTTKLWPVMREQERKHSFRQAGPDTLEDLWEMQRVGTFQSQRAGRALSAQTPAQWEAAHTDMSFREAISVLCEKRFEEARGWAELEAGLAEHGMHLEPRQEHGMVVAAGDDHMALSTVRRSFSRPKLETRFGQTWNEYRQAEAQSPAQGQVQSAEDEAAGREDEVRSGIGDDGAVPQELTSRHGNGSLTDGMPARDSARTNGSHGSDFIKHDSNPNKEGQMMETASEHRPPVEGVPSEWVTRTHAEQSQEEQALAFAARYYREQLQEAGEEHPARRYLAGRSFSDEVLERFAVGFAPDEWNGLTNAARREGISGETLERAGLAHARKDGRGHFDRFRGRLMLPYTDEAGQVSGFGARRIEGLERKTPTLTENPKYVNSPGSEIFRKRQEVFGLAQAMPDIQQEGSLYVTEGYTDAMRMREAGFENVVALAGTRMSDQHAERLARAAGEGSEVTFVFDGDRAGREASEEAIGRTVGAGLVPHVVELPEGQDADSFAREQGAESFQQYVRERRQHFAEHLLRGTDGNKLEQANPHERSEMMRTALDRATEAPTAELRERHFERVFEAATRDETEAAAYYRYQSFSSHFEGELERQGHARLPETERRGVPKPPATERTAASLGQSYEDLFGKPALDPASIKQKQAGEQPAAEHGASEQAGPAPDPARMVYLQSVQDRRRAERQLSSTEEAFRDKLGEVYDAAQAERAWRRNARRFGEENGRDSVVRPHAYPDVYARPGEARTKDTMTLYELERTSIEMTRARASVEAAFAREEQAQARYMQKHALEEDQTHEHNGFEGTEGRPSGREPSTAGSPVGRQPGEGQAEERRTGERGRALGGDGLGRGAGADRGRAGDRRTAGSDRDPAARDATPQPERRSAEADDHRRAADDSQRLDGERTQNPEGRHEGAARSNEETPRRAGDADEQGERRRQPNRGGADRNGTHRAEGADERREPSAAGEDPARAGVQPLSDAEAHRYGVDRRAGRVPGAAHPMGDGAAGASVGDPAPGEPAISLDAYGEAKGIWQAADEADRTQRLRGAHETLREVSPTGRWADEILADARKAEVRLEEKLSEIYARPERARARFDRLAENEGFRDALEKVYEDPGALGRLNGHKNFLGWTDEAYDQAAGAAETLHRYGGNHLAHLAAKKHLLEAQAKIAAFEERQLDYFGDLSEVKAKLGEVYRDPEAVLTRLQEATPRRENGRIRLEGSLAANPEGRPADTDLIEVMKRDPAALGQLKGGRAGWVEDADQERALAAIPAAAEAVRHEATRRHEMNRAHRATEGAAGLLDEYRAELTRIESKVSALPPQDHMDLKARQYASDLSPEGSRVAAEQARRIETAAARVGQAAKALGAARGEAVAESRNVDAVFARLYQKPGQARANFESAAGLDPSQPAYIDAAVHLRKDPEQFGALRDDLSRGDVKTFAKEAAGAHERYAGRAMGAARARGDLQQAQRQMNITIQGIPGVRQDVQQGQGRPGMSGAGYVAGMVGRKAGRELRKAAGLDRDI